MIPYPLFHDTTSFPVYNTHLHLLSPRCIQDNPYSTKLQTAAQGSFKFAPEPKPDLDPETVLRDLSSMLHPPAASLQSLGVGPPAPVEVLSACLDRGPEVGMEVGWGAEALV